MRWIILLLLSLMTCSLCLAKNLVRYHGAVSGANPYEAYYAALLNRALSETQSEFGGFDLKPVYTNFSQGRSVAALQQGKVFDVIWTMTSIDREEELLPVRIPLLKGLMGYRLFLIPKGKQYKFDRITSLDQLKQMTCGQSIDWPDTKILLDNGFRLVTAPADSLISMLKAGRFEYFPRGVQEIWGELASHLELEVERRLMLHYPAPMYFFVNKNNTNLADRLTIGLQRAIDNGGFDELFEFHKVAYQIYEKANLAERFVLPIDNPQLTEISRRIALREEFQLKPAN